jgi:hypothetical protein
MHRLQVDLTHRQHRESALLTSQDLHKAADKITSEGSVPAPMSHAETDRIFSLHHNAIQQGIQ